MRKLALLLGSLVVVASASAKEVVPAPVVVEEAPVQIIEKEVIVYRDKEEGFRPNGNVDLQYRWYGDTEGQNEDHASATDKAAGNGKWNGANNYSRLQLQGKINMTENQSLEYRVRNWRDLDKEDGRQSVDGHQTRLRYFYDHGNLGDSKVNFTSRVQYQNTDNQDADNQNVEYMARFNFADYMFNNDFVKTTDFTVAPRYAYVWNDNSSNYDNQLGVDLYTYHELPWGLSAELNVYTTQHFYGQDQFFDGTDKMKDKNFTVDVEAYLYHTLPLYQNDKLSITFNNEGGYDAYNWSQEKKFGAPHRGGKYDKEYGALNDKVVVNEAENGIETKAGKGVGTENAQYSVYLLSTIGVNYQATPNVTLYAAAGAEYRNWAITSENSASNWRWQPTAWAGFKTTF